MIAEVKPLEKTEIPSAIFVQELSAFGQRHRSAKTFEDDKLESYIDRNLGEALVNIDSLPQSVRQFIEHQNRVAGRDVGRSGMDSFHSEDRDSSLGPETTMQRLKSESRARWFRKLLQLMMAYTALYEDTHRMLRNAKEASKQARENIKDNFDLVKKSHKEINKAIQATKDPKGFEAVKQTLKNKEKRLKQELEDLEEYEERVLKPTEKKLNGAPLSENELTEIQDDIKERMPGRGWRIFQTIMKSMKSSFNSFPRMSRITPTPKLPAPELKPEPELIAALAMPESPYITDTDDGEGDSGSNENHEPVAP